MTLLAIDTSHAGGSLAIAKISSTGETDTDLNSLSWDAKSQHSEVALSSLESLLKIARVQIEQITHLAVNIGPGSFTGVRVGINLARTLGYALDLPILSVNRLALIAHSLASQPTEFTSIALRAIQDQYYIGIFDPSLRLVHGPLSGNLDALNSLSRQYHCTKVLIEGQTPALKSETCAEQIVTQLSGLRIYSSFNPWHDTIPLYIRGSEAEEKLKKGLLRPV